MEKLFLFESNLNDDNFLKINDLGKRRAKISLERLSLPVKYGGMCLRRIEDIFSASKTKVLMRALSDDKNHKFHHYLLYSKTKQFFYNETAKDDIIHPFLWFEQNYNKPGKYWSCFNKQQSFLPTLTRTVLTSLRWVTLFSMSKKKS